MYVSRNLGFDIYFDLTTLLLCCFLNFKVEGGFWRTTIQSCKVDILHCYPPRRPLVTWVFFVYYRFDEKTIQREEQIKFLHIMSSFSSSSSELSIVYFFPDIKKRRLLYKIIILICYKNTYIGNPQPHHNFKCRRI